VRRNQFACPVYLEVAALFRVPRNPSIFSTAAILSWSRVSSRFSRRATRTVFAFANAIAMNSTSAQFDAQILKLTQRLVTFIAPELFACHEVALKS
jgi:hypothetical protein